MLQEFLLITDSEKQKQFKEYHRLLYWTPRYFVPYKKNGKELAFSKAVLVDSRWYADTEAQAIDGYNKLLEKEIEKLKQKISELEGEKLL